MKPDPGSRLEGTIQVLIFILIGGMAGAASFTHVHDWTMHNVPHGTGNWFGWANAVISELTPTAAGLEIRRRKRQHRPVAYPMAVLIAAAALSLSAQVAEATPSITGWLLAAVPALAFLALSKLILSRTTATSGEQDDTSQPGTAGTDTTGSPALAIPAAATKPPEPELIAGARMAAFTHRQATGHDITADTLARHLAIPLGTAEQLITELGGTTPQPPVTTASDPAYAGSRA
jgi:hypothetical protein